MDLQCEIRDTDDLPHHVDTPPVHGDPPGSPVITGYAIYPDFNTPKGESRTEI
jgi:hypothetical protein